MEAILTALVSRMLKKFIKSNDSTNDLRVRLSNGRVLLHNLDLNLDSLLQSNLICVKRAFARELCVIIPWTALGSDPMEITLDTVEIVLVAQGKESDILAEVEDDKVAQSFEMDEENAYLNSASQSQPAKSDWLSSLLQTLGDVSLKVKNLVVKIELEETILTMMCGEFKIFTSFDNVFVKLEEDLSQYFSKWLVMNTIVLHVSVLNDREDLALQEPILTMSALRLHLLSSSPWATAQTLKPKLRIFLEDVISNLGVSHIESLLKLYVFILGMNSKTEDSFESRLESDSISQSLLSLQPPQEANAKTITEPEEDSSLSAPMEDHSQIEAEQTWFAFGTSFVSKTWDFVIDSEKDGNQIVTPNKDEFKLEKEMEANITNLWSTFDIYISFDQIMMNVLLDNSDKLASLDLKGMLAELVILNSTLDTAILQFKEIDLESPLYRNKSESSDCVPIVMCSQQNERQAFKMEVKSFGKEQNEQSCNIFIGQIMFGLHFPFLSDILQFLKGCQVKFHSLSKATGNFTTVKRTNGQDLGEEKEVSSESVESEVKSRPLHIVLEVEHVRIHLYYNFVLVSHFGILLEKNAITLGLNISKTSKLEITYSSLLHLIQSSSGDKRNKQSFQKLNKASKVRGCLKQGIASTDIDLVVEKLKCSWNSECVNSVKGNVMELMTALSIDKSRSESINSLIAILGLGRYFCLSLNDASFCLRQNNSQPVSSSIMMNGIFLGIPMDMKSSRISTMKSFGIGIASIKYALNERNLQLMNLFLGMLCESGQEQFCMEERFEEIVNRKLLVSSLEIVLKKKKQINVHQISISANHRELLFCMDVKNLIEARAQYIFEMDDVDEGAFGIKVGRILAEINMEAKQGKTEAMLLSLNDLLLHSESCSDKNATSGKTSLRSKSELSLQALQLTLFREGNAYDILSFQRKRVNESCLIYSTLKIGDIPTLDKQVDLKVQSNFILNIDEESLNLLLDLVSSATVKTSEVKTKEEEFSSTLAKITLSSFELHFYKSMIKEKSSRHVFLESDALILTIYPPNDNVNSKPLKSKASEIDMCMLTANLGVIEDLDADTDCAIHSFLGPADLHWKFQFLPESIVILIDADCLPLKVHWDIHSIIPSIFYNLFKIVYSHLKKPVSTSEIPSATIHTVEDKRENKPYLVIALQGSEIRLDCCGEQYKPEFMHDQSSSTMIGSILQLCCTKYSLAFHFWNSSLYSFTLKSDCEVRVNNPATFTVETIIDKVKCGANLGFCYESEKARTSVVSLPREIENDSFHLPKLLNFGPPDRQGISFGFTSQTLVLNMSSFIFDKVQALQAEIQKPVVEEGQPKKIIHLTENISIQNMSKVCLIFQQEGLKQELVVQHQESKNMVWTHPSYLMEDYSGFLCIRHTKQSNWKRAINFDLEGCTGISLSLSEQYQVMLAIQIVKANGIKKIIVRPRHCILNCTEETLHLRGEGLALKSHNFEGQSEMSNFNLCKSQLDLSVRKNKCEEVLLIEDVLDANNALNLRVCLGIEIWSKAMNLLALDSYEVCPHMDTVIQKDGNVDVNIGKLFCEVLSDHVDTGQILLRLHPALYIVNMLHQDIHVKSKGDKSKVIAGGCTSSILDRNIESIQISMCIDSLGFYEVDVNCSKATGCRETIFTPTDDTFPLFKCFLWVDEMKDSNVKCLRVIPKVTYHNANTCDLYLQCNESQGVQSQSMVKIAPGKSLSFTSPDDIPNGLVAIGLEDPHSKENVLEWSTLELEESLIEDESNNSQMQKGFLHYSNGKVLSVRAISTILPDPSNSNKSMDIKIGSAFYLVNLCRRDIEVRCETDGFKSTCKQQERIPLSLFSYNQNKDGQFTTEVVLKWKENLCDHECAGAWSDSIELDPRSHFCFVYIPSENDKFKNIGVCCYTFSYEDDYLMLIYEEDFPPVMVDNRTSEDFEMCMCFFGGEYPKLDDETIVSIPPGISVPDFRYHFGYLHNLLLKSKSGLTGNQGQHDLIDREAEIILSSADGWGERRPGAIRYRKEGDKEWSNALALGECEVEKGLSCDTEYFAPTWIIVLSDSQDPEEANLPEQMNFRNLNLSIEKLLVVYNEDKECLTQEKYRTELPIEGCLSKLKLSISKQFGKDSSEYNVDMSVGAFHIGIDKPSRAVLWSGVSDSEETFLKAFLYLHKSPLETHRGSIRNGDRNILSIESLDLRLAKTKIRLEDSTLDFLTRFRRRLYKNSSRLPIGSFLLENASTERKNPTNFEMYHLPRLYIKTCEFHTVNLLCTFRTGGRSELFPYTLDICDSPIVLQSLRLKDVYTNHSIFLNAVTSYFIAEGIGNAPQLVGSLGLLFNPLGIIQSIRNGVHDLIDIPMEGLKSGRPLRFVGGLGVGSVKFLGHVSGSILSSVSVFSSSSAKLLNYACGNEGIFGVVASPVGGALHLISKTAQAVLDTTGFNEQMPSLPTFTSKKPMESSVLRFQLICPTYLNHFLCLQAKWTAVDGIFVDVMEASGKQAVLVASETAFHLFLEDKLSFVCSIPKKVSKISSGEGHVICISAAKGQYAGKMKIECKLTKFAMQDFFHFIVHNNVNK